MKKLYSLFLTLFALLSVGFTAKADEVIIKTIDSSVWPKNTAYATEYTSDVEVLGTKWNLKGFNNNNNATWTAARVGNKATGPFTFTSASAVVEKISTVVVNANNRSGTNYASVALYVADNANFDNAEVSASQSIDSNTAKDYTFDITEPKANQYYKVAFSYTTAPSSNGVLEVTSFKLVWSDSGAETESGLAYSAEACNVTVGETYELPVLSNPNNLDVTYASSNTAVATVSESGVVTIPENSVGETTISATFAGNDTYKAGKASYVLTVKNPNLPGYSAEKPFTVAQAIEACTADGPKDIFVKGIITSVESFNSTYGSLTYYIGDEDGATTTLQVYGGLNIGGEKFTGKHDLAVGGTVLVNGNLKLFNNAPEIDLNSKIIEYTAPAILTVDTPTFSIKSGELEKGTAITIACATEGATIRYSMGANAEDIDENTVDKWDVYENAIEITEPITIKAIAMKDGCINSNIAVASYTIKVPADATFNFAAPETLTPAYPANKDDESLEAASDGSAGNMQALVNDVVFSQGNVSVSSTNTAEKGTPTKIYYQSTGKIQLRVYNGGSTTVKSTDPDNNITKIVFTYNNGSTSYKNVTAPATGTWTATTGTWTGNAQEVTFNYTGTQQINAIEVFCAEGLTAGIDNVVVDNDENTPVEYYNLQGVRVENPAAGQLYIKRQGSKATKVIIR